MPAGEQLPLSIPDDGPGGRLPRRVAPMQPSSVDGPFDDVGYLFEPWWPGARALAYIEDGRLRLEVVGLTDALASVPELSVLVELLAEDAVVLDGTLLALDDAGRPDAELLRSRLGGDRQAGRVAFVASDLLWSGGGSLLRRRFEARRRRLEQVLAEGDACIVGRAYRREGRLVAEALAALGIDGLSARALDARYRGGQAGEAWLRAPVASREPRPRPTLALIQRLPLDAA